MHAPQAHVFVLGLSTCMRRLSTDIRRQGTSVRCRRTMPLALCRYLIALSAWLLSL